MGKKLYFCAVIANDEAMTRSRKAIIVGASSGIGREVARLLLSDGWHLGVAARRAVAKLSINMQTTLSAWRDKGYEVLSASVRFVVAWKPKDEPKEAPETAVLLIDLTLSASHA